ncbi:hypothetical protein PIB30_086372 [Stylosanthes scabra]|uniref:C2H2-type domain-containing protein n=1 Tax=Stylosanthes scabra TaxID=79078 RepID=A0ABU6STE0_9FABA|nr:hypothetical protein [Stylosanthes scabra]
MASLSSEISGSTSLPTKKKRNQPGHPDPDAEVIALSPKSLLATNRFVCDVCNKGFQRDQNLQLHRRGHNLPWKLKQRSNKEVIRKKVYVCPEPTCVHHDPSRALGDLTGIKKHFCRKHGDKKWKCDKCSKRYAVHSDWKAHSKICGTREYKCDCGTIFSRRDSFIAHRAFCDALAQESTKAKQSQRYCIHHHHSSTSVKKELKEVNLRSENTIPSWSVGVGGEASHHHGRAWLLLILLQKVLIITFLKAPPPCCRRWCRYIHDHVFLDLEMASREEIGTGGMLFARHHQGFLESYESNNNGADDDEHTKEASLVVHGDMMMDHHGTSTSLRRL